MLTTLIAPLTQNAKLGEGVATTYRPVGDAAKGKGTCPSGCVHLPENGGACYTKKFLVNRQQNLSRERNDDLSRLSAKGAKLVRLHTSGDFFKSAEGGYVLDTEYLDAVVEWCRQNPDVTVWTYTHDVSALIDHGYTYAVGAFPDNLHIVASSDTLAVRDLAKAHGFRTARVIDAEDAKVEGETFCPYDLHLHRGVKSPDVTCAGCTLCFNKKHANDIAFLKQGK